MYLAFGFALGLALSLFVEKISAQEIESQRLTEDQAATALSFMKKMDDETRSYLLQMEPYRARLTSTKAVFELVGSTSARAAKNGSSYSIIVPAGVYFLAWNVAGMIASVAEHGPSSQFASCARQYKSYLALYLSPKNAANQIKTIPILFEHYAERSCGLSRPKLTPEVEKARNEVVSLGFFFVLLHEYAHVLNGDLEAPATVRQETDADSFAMFHLFNQRTRTVAPVFFFLFYTLVFLDAPATFPAGGAPPVHDRLGALFAGARGFAQFSKSPTLMDAINREHARLLEDGRKAIPPLFCPPNFEGTISALPGFLLTCD